MIDDLISVRDNYWASHRAEDDEIIVVRDEEPFIVVSDEDEEPVLMIEDDCEEEKLQVVA